MKIASFAVENRLAACVNIAQHPHISIYEWQGKIEHGQEIAAWFKTTKGAYPSLEAAIKSMHSYETPCILALDITNGNSGFLGWIKEQTSQ